MTTKNPRKSKYLDVKFSWTETLSKFTRSRIFFSVPLFESEANLFILVCRIKGAARVDILFVKKVILKSSISVFDIIKSYLSSCKALWFLTALEVRVLSLAMVIIETPGLKPKRLLILDKNFHVPSTMSLNHGKVQIFF